MCPGLVPGSSVLLGKKVAGENPVNAMEGETVRLGDLLELFNERGGVGGVRSQPHFYLREIA